MEQLYSIIQLRSHIPALLFSRCRKSAKAANAWSMTATTEPINTIAAPNQQLSSEASRKSLQCFTFQCFREGAEPNLVPARERIYSNSENPLNDQHV